MKEFVLIQNGFVERFEIENREEWERTRWQTFYLIHPRVREAAKIKKPTDLITFNWEKEFKKEDTGEFIKNNIALFDEIFPKTLN